MEKKRWNQRMKEQQGKRFCLSNCICVDVSVCRVSWQFIFLFRSVTRSSFSHRWRYSFPADILISLRTCIFLNNRIALRAHKRQFIILRFPHSPRHSMNKKQLFCLHSPWGWSVWCILSTQFWGCRLKELEKFCPSLGTCSKVLLLLQTLRQSCRITWAPMKLPWIRLESCPTPSQSREREEAIKKGEAIPSSSSWCLES